MKHFTKIRSIILTIILLLGAIPAAAVERPFAMSGTGVAVLITDENGNLIGATPTGSGTATHLGSWTVAGNVTYTPDGGVLRSGGQATLAAANGDTLIFEVDGVLDPIAAVDQGVFRFIGGTGRFAGASGTIDFVVSINPANGGFELTAVGRIDY